MHLQENFVALSHRQEISQHYKNHVPVELQSHWQSGQQMPKFSLPMDSKTPHDEGQGSGRRGKRKRMEYEPNEKERLAQCRHDSVKPALKAAILEFQTWLSNTKAPNLESALSTGDPAKDSEHSTSSLGFCEESRDLEESRLGPESAAPVEATAGNEKPQPGFPEPKQDTQAEHPACPSRPWVTMRKQETLQMSTQGEGDLDLLALAKLIHLLKPKFVFGDGSSSNLFNCCLRNPTEDDKECLAHETPVIVPRGCSFLISDISKFDLLLEEPGALHGFDCIVVDPPWENRSVKRQSQYPTLLSRQLLGIPVPQLLKQAGGLVVIWMTNKQKLHDFVEKELLPAWSLQKLAMWFWMKVTENGQLIGPLDSMHHRPYEPLLIAAPCGYKVEHPLKESLCLFSVPGEHSRKPHLGRLLKRHLGPSPRCLELFARELAKGWTSAGNQVLHFQQSRYFQTKEASK